jgi:hypothetical protein
MFGKPVYSETVKRYDRQDPDGMVKAELLESQCPNCKVSNRGMTVEKLEPGRYLEPDLVREGQCVTAVVQGDDSTPR